MFFFDLQKYAFFAEEAIFFLNKVAFFLDSCSLRSRDFVDFFVFLLAVLANCAAIVNSAEINLIL